MEKTKTADPENYPNLWPWQARTRAAGELYLHREVGVNTLVKNYGSPIFVLDLDAFEQRCQLIAAAMAEEFWDGYGMSGASVYYAGKAFLCTALGKAINAAGMGIDTASEGELRCALNPAMGVPAAKIGLHGNNKTEAALRLALESGIGRIIVDSLSEIQMLQELAAEMGKNAPVMIRLTTGVHAGGHDFIATAHEDQKFGLSLASGAAWEAVEKIRQAGNLQLVGLHSHIGSQIQDLQAFKVNAGRVMQFRARVQQLGLAVPEVDLGGGLAISYTGESAPSAAEYARALAEAVRDACTEAGTDLPHISIEPGRWVVGPTCVTLYQVGAVKDIALESGGSRRYVSVNGGMSDNPRPILYGAEYTAILANRSGSSETLDCRVVGAHCESGDILIKSVALPSDIRRGDILAIPATGAYGYSMASNYNWFTKPGVLGLSRQFPEAVQAQIVGEECQATWLVRPETIDDLLALDNFSQ